MKMIMVKRSLTYSLVLCAALISTISNVPQISSSHAQTVGTLVINEVAYRGTDDSSSDEWIELYNPSSTPITNLSNWVLTIERENNGQIEVQTTINIQGQVEAHGYYLLERTDNNAVSNVEADFIYSGSLTDAGRRLVLYNNGTAVDQLDTENGWYIDINTSASMERINPFLPGNLQSNWAQNDGLTKNGLGVNGGQIIGTPGQVNSATVLAFNHGYAPPLPPQATPPFNISIAQIGHLIQITWETLSGALSSILYGTTGILQQDATTAYLFTPNEGSGNYEFTLQTDNGLGEQSPAVQSRVNYIEPLPPSPGQILINEFNARVQAGEKEWIELYSPNTWVDLSTCQLSDAASSIYSFQATDAIGPQSHFYAELSSQKLNNSGDTITLSCSGQLINEVNYGSHSTGGEYIAAIYPESNNFIPDPTEFVTIGRTPSGGTDWALFNKSTRPTINTENFDLRPVPGVINSQTEVIGSDIVLNWINPEYNKLAGIRIYLQSTGQLLADTQSITEEAIVHNFTRPGSYEFRIIPYNTAGLEAEGDEVSVVSASVTGVFLSEVLPNPKTGGTEFIEIANITNNQFDLSDYTIDIYNGTASVPETIELEFILPFLNANEVFSFDPFASWLLNLNNTNGFLELIDGNGVPVSILVYPFVQNDVLTTPEKGSSVGYNQEPGIQTYLHPTPNETNIIRNESPQAVITLQGSKKLEGCNSVNFNPTGQDSIDPDEDDLVYHWQYLNEKELIILEETDKKNPSTFTLSSDLGKSFTIALTVTDPFLESDSTSVQVNLGVNCAGRRTNAIPNQYTFSQYLIITELFPNPKGVDTGNEFIEIHNAGPESVSLLGWKINDGSSHLLPGLILEPRAYLSLTNQVRFTLRNAASTIQLIDPEESVISLVTYNNAEEGRSYSRKQDGSYSWATATPGKQNLFPVNIPIVYVQESAKIIISRFLANPNGPDKGSEWIEITNTNTTPVSLQNWQLDNRPGSSSPFTIPALTLEAGKSHQFSDSVTGLTLRNSSDQIRLFDDIGNLKDQLEWKSNIASGLVVRRQNLLKGTTFSPETATVVKVIDGDTVDVRMPDGTTERIRLIGVDTPETVHPFKEVEFYGKEASNYTKATLTGQTVILEYDLEKRGKYGRLLAYLILNGQSFNEQLISTGHAFAYLRFPFRYREQYRRLQEEARAQKVGMWAEIDEETVRRIQEEPTDEEFADLAIIEEVLEELEENEEEVGAEDLLPSLEEQEYDQTGWENILLTEIYPNPPGKDKKEDEWIEVHNSGPIPVDLLHWTIRDHTDKTIYTFGSIYLKPQQYLLVTGFSKNLKNSKAQFSLIDPIGQTRSIAQYTDSIKESHSLAINPLLMEWQITSTPSPAEQNPISFISNAADQDLDGLSDDVELALGLSPQSFDTDEDGYPDDFEMANKTNPLVKSMHLEDAYRLYLKESLTVKLHQTTRTITFSGESRPYTMVKATIFSQPKTVMIPVEPDGTWKYKVDLYLESGNHKAQVSAIDPNNTASPIKDPILFTLKNRINVAKAPKSSKAKTSKSKAPKPVYLIQYPNLEFLQGVVTQVTCQQYFCTLNLEDGSNYAINTKSLPQVLAQTIFTPQASILYSLEEDKSTIGKFQLIPTAMAASHHIKSTKNQPLFVFAILIIGLLVAYRIDKKRSKEHLSAPGHSKK